MLQETFYQHFSPNRVLLTRVKLFGEEHPDTAESYANLGVTQHA